MRDAIKHSAEGFAVLDFVQGHVATELPTEMARNIVDVLRDAQSADPSSYVNDLVMYWLENYRRAYSHMVMRVLEDGAGSITA